MLKINITEGKPNRFEQAANILGTGQVSFCARMMSNLVGEVEVREELYARLEDDIAAVGDWVAKDWLRAYGVGEEAKKLRMQDLLNTEITGKIPPMKIVKYSAEHPDGIELKVKQLVENAEGVKCELSLNEQLQALNCNKVWEHKKSGNRYDAVAVTNTKATKEGFPVMVVYTRDGALWSRPISEFFENFRVAKATSPSEEGKLIAEAFRLVFDPVELSPLSKMESYASKEEAWRRLQEQALKMPDTFPDRQILDFVNVSTKEFSTVETTTVKEKTPVPAHPLQEVFDAVIAQVTTGKGQRHGGGEQPFFEQPWVTTTQQVGIGFPLGQAMKKLGESSSKPDAESFETELLGAIAYAAMAYLANKKLAVKS